MSQPVPAQAARSVALFDFDGTLTTGDTLMPFLKYVVGAPRYYAKLALISPVLLAYFAKLLRNDVAKQIVLMHYLAGYHVAELFDLGKKFGEEIIPSMLRPEGMERLRWHQELGHDCVLVSASLDIYLESWASSNGFIKLICTSIDEDADGLVSGRIKGKNCHGVEKVEAIKLSDACANVGYIYAYGDTVADVPMLKMANQGYMLKSGCFAIFHKRV